MPQNATMVADVRRLAASTAGRRLCFIDDMSCEPEDARGHTAVIDLEQLAQGACAVVRRVAGGLGVVSRLSAIGVVSGAPIEMLVNRRRGPVVVLVHGTRIALGRGEARRVLVEERQEHPR